MDRIGVEGHLTIYRVDRLGRTKVFSDHNLITNLGIQMIPWLLSNDLSAFNGVARNSDLAIQRMEIGNDPTSIPAITDTTSVSQFVYAPPVEVFADGATPGSIATASFGGFMPADQGNNPALPSDTNWTLHEEALILGNGVVFAKKVFSIKKNDSFGLYFKHDIRFVRA